MTSLITESKARLGLPPSWPAALHPSRLAEVDANTPYLLCDLATVSQQLHRTARRGAERRGLLRDEVQLQPRGAAHPGRPRLQLRGRLHRRAATRSPTWASTRRRCCSATRSSRPPPSWPHAPPGCGGSASTPRASCASSPQYAPGSAVYIRLRVDDSHSIFPLSRKFGCEAHQARALLLLARELGLRPYGLTFHVGSQCAATSTWRQAIAGSGAVDARPRPGWHHAGDARPRRRLPGPVRPGRADHRPDRRGDRAGPRRPAPLPAGADRRRAGPAPGCRERGDGGQRAGS